MHTPRRNTHLRQANRQVVLRHLYFNGPISRLELSKLTGLSPASVTNVVGELLAEEIVLETGQQESEGGRPRAIMAVNPEYGYFVGIDMGETHIQLGLFDLMLHNLNMIRVRISSEMNSPHHFVELISQATDELISQAKIDPHKVLGVGIGVPGIVEHNDCICVFLPIWGWQRVPFGELLKERIPFPLYLDNGAKAMTLAESWFGAGQNVQNLAVILLGTGVGSGILMHGNLYRGATNSAGEWGHTKIVLEGRECRCGSKGCLEAYVGALGIITSLRELAPDSPWLASDDQLAILDNVVAAAEQGNALALQVLSSTANNLGAGIANLINLFNPELIVVGGWAGLRIGKFIMPELNQSVERYTLPPSLAATRIDLCRFGEDAICIGAACLILDQFLSGSQRFGRRSPR